jgi:hypothetical protein
MNAAPLIPRRAPAFCRTRNATESRQDGGAPRSYLYTVLFRLPGFLSDFGD